MNRFPKTKNCKQCKECFPCPSLSPASKYLISQKAWEKREFCSHKCAAIARAPFVAQKLRGKCSDAKLAHIRQMAKKRTGLERLPISNEWRLNLRESHLGQEPWNKGKRVPQMCGENHPNWIKDRSKLQRYGEDNKDRASSAHRGWSRQVKNRDGWKCRIANGDCSGRVESHHILSWKNYKELRFEQNNGITLCHAHHPRKRAEEKRLIPMFQELVAVSKAPF